MLAGRFFFETSIKSAPGAHPGRNLLAYLLVIFRSAEDGDVLGESAIDHDCIAAGELLDFFDAAPFDQHILAGLGQDSGSCRRRFSREQTEHDSEAVDDAVLFGLTCGGAAAYSLAVDEIGRASCRERV